MEVTVEKYYCKKCKKWHNPESRIGWLHFPLGEGERVQVRGRIEKWLLG